MQNKLKRWIIVFFALILVMSMSACSSNSNGDNNTPTNGNNDNNNDDNDNDSTSLLLSDLNIGDIVYDSSWEWEFKQGDNYTTFWDDEPTLPVRWIVVAKDHYDANTVTLVSEHLIGFYIFDNSILESGLLAGRNHWGNSGLNNGAGLRPWLNSTGEYSGEGFYNAFSSQFKNIVVSTTIENIDGDTKVPYTTTDNVFIASHTEMGGTLDDFSQETFELGKAFPYFVDADYTKLEAGFPRRFTYDYWSRSPYARGYRVVGMITTSGLYVDWFADASNIGVRPVVNVTSSILVSKDADEENVYEIIYE